MLELGDFLVAHKAEIKTLAVVYVHDVVPIEWHADLMARAEKEGFEVVLNKDYPLDVKDLSEVLLDIKAKNPDALIGLSYPPDAFLMMKQLQEIDFSPKLLYFSVGPGLSVFSQIFGAAAEGVLGMGSWSRFRDTRDSKEFYEGFLKMYGRPPELPNSSDGFSGAQIMQQAVEKAGTLDKEKIREVLATETFEVVNGIVTLRDGQNVTGTIGVFQCQQGEVHVLWPPEFATGEFIYPKPPWP